MSQRIERINELLKQELGRFIREDIDLPAEAFVTVTEVNTTPDMKVAKIIVTIFPENIRGSILKILQKNSRRLHELLKKELTTKFIPNLTFQIDEQEIFANKVNQILDEIKPE
ncbi:MAG: ribosome-binding factor A [Candidatus Parcubacteria bacterium]|nr:ribosome-binding factor A [Candidatus Parcubacteria bacterium]